MALEPRTVSIDDTPNPELVGVTRRFWVTMPLSALLLPLGMSDVLLGAPVQRLLGHWLAWIELALAAPVAPAHPTRCIAAEPPPAPSRATVMMSAASDYLFSLSSRALSATIIVLADISTVSWRG